MENETYEEIAALVGLITPIQNEEKASEYLEELAFLTETAGAKPQKIFLQRLNCPDPNTFIGPGKLIEIKSYIIENNINVVIFDDELSARQLRNLEKELNVKILDRTNLILDIFAKR
ncbi:MAG TPA: GTPase HflX, partial [Paludibacteraceae bacterium]|nr:GTPase HflX [Paludibacteraceae bacterium]